MAHKEAKRFGNFVEKFYGFAQGVKSGDTIFLSGQTAFIEGEDLPADMAAQTRSAYANVGRVLEMFGATFDDIVDEIVFVTDMPAAASVAHEVRSEVYGPDFDVASTLVEVAGLASPELLVEIKCTART